MIVHKTIVQSRNFITDFGERVKNIVGGRLKAYEEMIDFGINQANTALMKEYPNAHDLRLEITEFSNSSIAITLYGVVDDD
jgi:uncharacterized protein YbjQ (UPF0145 family)